MGYEFDRMTAVTPTETGYDTELDAGWVVGGGVNGGDPLAILGNSKRSARRSTGSLTRSVSARTTSVPARPGRPR